MQRVTSRVRRFPDLDSAILEVDGLSPRDIALARAIDHAVSRRWLTLTAVLCSRVDQPWERLEPAVQAALLVGAAQLLFMDRLPDHAVVHEGVEWIKQRRPKASGLVNAVLRRTAALRNEIVPAAPAGLDRRDAVPLEDGRWWMLCEPVFSAEPAARLGELTSLPQPLVAHWSAAFGWNRCINLAMHGLVHPPIIVAGLTDDEAAMRDDLTPHTQPGFHIFTGDPDALGDLLAHDPAARVQDPTTAAAVNLLGRLPAPPRTIIDYCAGRGTKTRQLASMFPHAEVIATDTDEARLAVLRESCAGRPGIRVVSPGQIREMAGRGDVLVLDVPCSNTGVLARRVEARYRFSKDSLKGLVNLQRQIVADALPLLADAGTVLYATCSIEPSENEGQAAWIRHWHRMTSIAEASRLPEGVPGDAPTGYIDGGFAALLTRAG